MDGSWGLMEVFLVSCPVFKALKMALFLGNGITVHKGDNLPCLLHSGGHWSLVFLIRRGSFTAYEGGLIAIDEDSVEVSMFTSQSFLRVIYYANGLFTSRGHLNPRQSIQVLQ